jgi:predicted Zn-dependent protease
MAHSIGDRAQKRKMTRRDFLWLSSVSTAGVIAGCAVNPVTGKRQLMLMSRAEEIELDKSYSPHQFSADYGKTQDDDLNRYLSQIGNDLAALSHRPDMPYSFHAVNATYVNAYAFPGGSIAVTRGILLNLGNEGELAALLGHEIGHVNARHTAQRMTKNLLLNAAVLLGTVVVASKDEKAAPWVAGLGGIGAGLLLAHYSREDERQADELGMRYMTQAGYDPNGMVGLMDMLKSLSSRKPNVIEVMFSTHPMSDERYRTAENSVKTTYAEMRDGKLNRERYMDHTAALRRIAPAIEAMQSGQREMAGERYSQAEPFFQEAVRRAPGDYTARIMLAQCQIAIEKPDQAVRYAGEARNLYPEEANSYHVGGIAEMMRKNYSAAFNRFAEYERILPGNPNTVFLKGFTRENMEQIPQAAAEYQRYLNLVTSGEQADHARQRLTEWGYMEQQQ